jgi:thiamine biosynthesis lipoprotein ApbE
LAADLTEILRIGVGDPKSSRKVTTVIEIADMAVATVEHTGETIRYH